MTIRSKKKN